MDYPKLSRSPIEEAMIGIQVGHQGLDSFSMLRQLAEGLAADFPTMREIGALELEVASGASTSELDDLGADSPAGVALRSTDDGWVVQFRIDGFAISKLRPYDSWDALVSKAGEMWRLYRAETGELPILGASVRFINRIPFPAGRSVEDVFQTTFVFAPGIPRKFAGFMLRVDVPFEAEQAMASVSQTLISPDDGCLFDIDVATLEKGPIEECELWKRLDKLREIKNQMFFSSLKPGVIEEFR